MLELRCVSLEKSSPHLLCGEQVVTDAFSLLYKQCMHNHIYILHCFSIGQGSFDLQTQHSFSAAISVVGG